LTDIVIEKKPWAFNPTAKRTSNLNLLISQEADKTEDMAQTPRMRKAQTRDGLVDIPSLLAEQGRKAVKLDKSSYNLESRGNLSAMAANRRHILAI